jgi:hypothetical protein
MDNQDDNKEKEVVSNVVPLFPDALPETQDEDGNYMDEFTFTNDKNNPMLTQLFRMFYTSVFKNKLGLMHAKVRGKDEVHTVIVGVEITPEGILTWPLAKILTEEEQDMYMAPDGEGNYVGVDD